MRTGMTVQFKYDSLIALSSSLLKAKHMHSQELKMSLTKKRCVKEKGEKCYTWTVSHRVKVTVGEHEMLRAAFRLEPDSDVGDAIIEAGETSEKVNGERTSGALHVHRQLMGARCTLNLDVLNLLQQVANCEDFILLAADWPRANAGDLLQVPSTSGDGDRTENR